MKKRRFIQILRKYTEGKASEEESRLIETYYSLLLAKSKLESEKNEQNDDRVGIELINEIWNRVHEQERATTKIVRLLPTAWKIAVAATVIIGSAIIFYTQKFGQTQERITYAANQQQNKADKITPGKNTAILTLSDGKKVPLDSLSNGSLATQGNMRVFKLNNGQLAYKSEAPAGRMRHNPAYNTLTTPRGGQYQIILPDGTKVWLNAASSLHYPVSFTANTRTVEIEGEGYFEIAPDPGKPFIVKVGNVKIEVLGTRFDVSSYQTDDNIKTILENGAIRVTGGKKSVLLKPGEVAGFDKKTGEINVGTTNVAASIAWKNGLFYFDNTNIKEIMAQVSRWYDVNVVYKTDELSHKTYSGTLPRYSEVTALLKMLEMTGTVHFKINGRTIIVTN